MTLYGLTPMQGVQQLQQPVPQVAQIQGNMPDPQLGQTGLMGPLQQAQMAQALRAAAANQQGGPNAADGMTAGGAGDALSNTNTM